MLGRKTYFVWTHCLEVPTEHSGGDFYQTFEQSVSGSCFSSPFDKHGNLLTIKKIYSFKIYLITKNYSVNSVIILLCCIHDTTRPFALLQTVTQTVEHSTFPAPKRALHPWPQNCRKTQMLRDPDNLSLALSCCCCSVVSDSFRPQGLQPARLLCPWDSPGKNTGVGCHFLLHWFS